MTTLIRPGILVSLKSTVEGGVVYQRKDLDSPTSEAVIDGAVVEKWETIKTVTDAKEHDAATKARSKALGAIRKICSVTTFGLLCGQDKEKELDAAIAQAREITAAHNASAKFTHVRVYVLKGHIASTDEEAARSIGQEVAGLVKEMNESIDRLDPEAIREAARRASEISALLGPDQAEAVAGAIEQARKAARAIVKRVQNEGEAAAIVLKDLQRGSLEKARIAFLDFDAPVAPTEVVSTLPAVNVQRVAGLDLGSEPPEAGDDRRRSGLDLGDAPEGTVQ